ncbi:MAG: CHASE2 domain-containing protein, partial [Pseudobdellovibrio sp.]
MRWLYQKRGFLLRALICWAFSLFFLKFDENGNYDNRFKLRGEQKASQEIVLITLKTSEFSKMYDLKTSTLINATELSDLTDSFYWDKDIWVKLLEKLLKQEPKKIGVSMYFGNNIGQTKFSSREVQTLKDSRIIWATNSSEPEKLSLPIATLADKSNIGHIDIMKDDDGIVRRIINPSETLPDFSEKLLEKTNRNKIQDLSIINFKGTNAFTEVSLS